MKAFRSKWSNERVGRDLLEICAKLGHFPSNTELVNMGRNDLACATTKRGGLLMWSSRLGVPRLSSDSDTGWMGEDSVAILLKSKGFIVERRPTLKCFYDLLINSTVRVDVKTASFSTYGACSGWFYRIGKKPECEVYILHRNDTNDCTVLPRTEVTSSSMTITVNGKYASYLNNWNILNTNTHQSP